MNNQEQNPTQGQVLSLIALMPTITMALMTPLSTLFDHKNGTFNNLVLLCIIGLVSISIVLTTFYCIQKVLKPESIPFYKKKINKEEIKENE